MNSFLQDLRYALRQLHNSPGFGGTVVATLALSIGITAAIFSVLYAMLIRPLPFASPGRLVQVFEKNDKLKLTRFAASILNYVSWRQQTRAFEDLGAAGYSSFALTGHGDPEQFQGGTITPSLMPVMGISRALAASLTAVTESMSLR